MLSKAPSFKSLPSTVIDQQEQTLRVLPQPGREPASRPRVLVLMATFNGCRWIEEQLESVLIQQEVELSLVVGDDASTDGTLELLKSRYGQHPSVTLKPASVRSGSAGANFRRLINGADATEVEYVAFADQDDTWHPRKLVSAIDAMDKHASDAYSGATEALWPDGRHRTLTPSDRIRRADFLFESAGQGCTYMVTADVFSRLKEFCRLHPGTVNAFHYHDWLTYLLVRSWSLRWYFDRRVFISYRQHAGNEIGARGGALAYSRRLAMIRNGWYSSQIQLGGKLYQLAGGNDPQVRQLINALAEPNKKWWVRVRVATLSIRHGRRRLRERVVLAAAALSGWL